MNRYFFSLLVLCLALVTSCSLNKESPRGFSLPEGSATAGKTTFVALQCNACHSTPDIEQLPSDLAKPISVHLGGEVSFVKTYADLLTSIINPSHRLAPGHPLEAISDNGESLMRNYNEVMTVEQLIDLVSYLQAHYKVRPREPSVYRGYLN
ncbi:MAG: cytochrome C [Halioglobus sp.]